MVHGRKTKKYAAVFLYERMMLFFSCIKSKVKDEIPFSGTSNDYFHLSIMVKWRRGTKESIPGLKYLV